MFSGVRERVHWEWMGSGKIMIAYVFWHENGGIHGIWAFWHFLSKIDPQKIVLVSPGTHFMHRSVKKLLEIFIENDSMESG